MTNAFEALLLKVMNEEDHSEELRIIRDFHTQIINDLGLSENESLLKDLDEIYEELSNALYRMSSSMGYDFVYDQSVSCGELLSASLQLI